MARKPMKKFGTGGSTNEDRMRRKTDDIQSDYQKAQTRNAGNTAKLNVAKAKFEQRMADAKDDDAKRRGADRTATRAGEKAAESALSEARRTRGDNIARRDALGAKLDAEGPAITPSKLPDLKVSGAPRISASSTRPVAQRSAPAPVTPRPGPRAGAAADPAEQRERPSFVTDLPIPGKRAAQQSRTPQTPAPAAQTRSQQYQSRAAALDAEAAKERAAEQGATGQGSAALARLKNLIGFGSEAATRNASMFRRMDKDTTSAIDQRTQENSQAAAAKAKRRADIIAAGEAPGASGYARSQAKFYRDNPTAMRKGGTVKKKPAAKKPVIKYAKGGSIDGCAIRGKTRAGRTK